MHVRMRRPLQRGTIVEQLHRAGLGRAPSRPVRRFLGTTFRFVVSGIVFYTAVALVSGGQRRVQSDLSRLQVGAAAQGLDKQFEQFVLVWWNIPERGQFAAGIRLALTPPPCDILRWAWWRWP